MMLHCHILPIISFFSFRYQMFPNRRGGVSGFGVPPSRRPVPQEQAGGGGGGGRHNWGQGFRLGDDWSLWLLHQWINTETSNINAAEYGFYDLGFICVAFLLTHKEKWRGLFPSVTCFPLTLDVISHCYCVSQCVQKLCKNMCCSRVGVIVGNSGDFDCVSHNITTSFNVDRLHVSCSVKCSWLISLWTVQCQLSVAWLFRNSHEL